MSGVTVYYYKFCPPSIKVLIALHEKRVDFKSRHIDLLKREQHERWFLELNPRGEVPVLKHGETVVADSNTILRYLDGNFGGGEADKLFPSAFAEKVEAYARKADDVPTFSITYGAAVFHTEHVTDCLRWPFDSRAFRDAFKAYILSTPSALKRRAEEVADMEAGKILEEKASGWALTWPVFAEKDLYLELLTRVESFLDEVESELGSDDHLGPWLCGPTYTAADIALSCVLLRLHQIGMDGRFWAGGIRPCVSVYAEMAFKRPSFERATEWSKHRHEVSKLDRAADSSHLSAAYWGVGAAVALAGVYAVKKLMK